LLLERRVVKHPHPEGGEAVAVYEAIMLMVAFGGFIVSLIGLILLIVRLIRK